LIAWPRGQAFLLNFREREIHKKDARGWLKNSGYRPGTISNFAVPEFVDPPHMPENTKIILLADDDPEDQEILEDMLIELQPSVVIRKVDSGKQAVDFLLSCPENALPGLIILDYAMPVYNAVEVMEHIARRSVLQSVPKVVWSSSRQPEHVKTCMAKGALSYFVKPNKMAELTEIAKQMLAICRTYTSVAGK
jgi:CheY-like chemotaxis protein